jgi:hypothetical protein
MPFRPLVVLARSFSQINGFEPRYPLIERSRFQVMFTMGVGSIG